MSSTSVSPTEDNRKNTIDDTMYSTLEGVVRNQEQTYDEFLNSFTYLKKDELNKMQSVAKPKMINMIKTEAKRTAISVDKKRQGSEPAQSFPYEREEIEEEILSEGTTTSRLNSVKVIRTGANVKVDNFVESEEIAETDSFTIDKDQDIGPLNTYSASFSNTNTPTPDHQSNQALARNPPDVTDLFNSLSLDENSTDKLLMNFLADLQNEENEKSRGTGTAGKPTDEGNSNDIQTFLNKLPKKKQQANGDDVSFTDDESDGVLTMCEDTKKSDVKVLLDQNRLKQIEGQSDPRTVKDTYKAVLMDSEGNVTLDHSDETVADSDEVTEVDAEDIVFPGEVREKETNEGDVNERLLDFKCTYRVGNNETTDQEPGSDMVQPFSLDETFDYDNVVLTPKYSAEDVERLRTRQPLSQQTVVM